MSVGRDTSIGSARPAARWESRALFAYSRRTASPEAAYMRESISIRVPACSWSTPIFRLPPVVVEVISAWDLPRVTMCPARFPSGGGGVSPARDKWVVRGERSAGSVRSARGGAVRFREQSRHRLEDGVARGTVRLVEALRAPLADQSDRVVQAGVGHLRELLGLDAVDAGGHHVGVDLADLLAGTAAHVLGLVEDDV